MSSKSEDKLDWWGDYLGDKKREPKKKTAQKNEKGEKVAKKPRSSKKSKLGLISWLNPRSLALRLALHAGLIVVAIVLMSVVAHYLLLSTTRHSAHMSVPHFESMLVDEASRMAEENGLKLIVSDSIYAPLYPGGAVLEQNPAAGVEVKPGRAIYVIINALQREMVIIPYVSGRSLRQARNMLDMAGIKIESLIYKQDLATNYVLSQRYADIVVEEGSNLRAPRGSSVVLYVGVNAGDDKVVVPQLIGRSLYEASSLLLDSGLNIGKITRSGEGITLESEKLARVVSQSIAAEEEASLGDRISFAITLDGEEVDQALADIEAERLIKQKQLAEEARLLDSINSATVQPDVEDKSNKKSGNGSGFKDLFD